MNPEIPPADCGEYLARLEWRFAGTHKPAGEPEIDREPPPYVTRGGRSYSGILALQAGTLSTGELGLVMGVPTDRVHAYMRWALSAGAVERRVIGKHGRVGVQTTWGLGKAATVLHGSGIVTQRRKAVPRPKPANSVFTWRP